MLKPVNLFYVFGIIAVLLAVISILNLTTRSIIGQVKVTKTVNFIYDDVTNKTQICPISVANLTIYKLEFDRTDCYNKTLHFNFVPWINFKIWREFRDNLKRPVVENVTEPDIENVTLPLQQDDSILLPRENFTNRKEKEKPSKVVYTLLGCLLILSSTFACCEVFKDKLRKHDDVDKKDANAESRKCSLAEFTINRHIRKESQANLQKQTAGDKMAVKNKNGGLNKQASLDRVCFKTNSTGSEKPVLVRWSSFPANSSQQQGGERDVSLPMTRQAALGSGQLSCDLSGDELSPDLRRKSRHFIRRH